MPNFTKEIFTVCKRMGSQVPVYKLKDDAGEILDGTIYSKSPNCRKLSGRMTDVYLVEKILRKRKRKGVVEYFVKWKDYPDKFNIWVGESDVLKL